MKYDAEAVADLICELNKLTPHQLAGFWEHIQRTFPVLPRSTGDSIVDEAITKLNNMREWEIGNTLFGAMEAQRKQCHDVVASWWLRARKTDAAEETLTRTGRDLEGVGELGADQVPSSN